MTLPLAPPPVGAPPVGVAVVGIGADGRAAIAPDAGQVAAAAYLRAPSWTPSWRASAPP
ncbi:hypothetical protein ACFQ8E_21260 [Isoptericola sp. NPDC056573]|uniref:hypothetical protein n=1 Tax=Isoptericola sp. NPDC056573 TaxID=3345868 RepID=UPI0036C19C59